MSIQWTFIAGYLYFEIGVVTIMMLPIFSARRWNQFFKSRLFYMFQQHAAAYFYVLLGVLSMFLLDAVREMRKYSHSTEGSHTHLASGMKDSVKLFRAQRNFYITGFAIFLAFVIRRLVNMLIIQDELTIRAQKIIKRAESAVKLATTTVLANTIGSEEENKNFDELKNNFQIAEDQLEKSQINIQPEEIKNLDELKNNFFQIAEDLLDESQINMQLEENKKIDELFNNFQIAADRLGNPQIDITPEEINKTVDDLKTYFRIAEDQVEQTQMNMIDLENETNNCWVMYEKLVELSKKRDE